MRWGKHFFHFQKIFLVIFAIRHIHFSLFGIYSSPLPPSSTSCLRPAKQVVDWPEWVGKTLLPPNPIALLTLSKAGELLWIALGNIVREYSVICRLSRIASASSDLDTAHCLWRASLLVQQSPVFICIACQSD